MARPSRKRLILEIMQVAADAYLDWSIERWQVVYIFNTAYICFSQDNITSLGSMATFAVDFNCIYPFKIMEHEQKRATFL